MKSVNLILDTDAGSDCDDMMALAYLVYAMKHRNVTLRAVSYSNGCAYGISAIRAFLRCYGAKVPPVGRASGEVRTYDHYCREIAERFSCAEDRALAEDAVTVLRRALCDSDRAVLCGIGPLMNIAALLQSPLDAISPLDGVAIGQENRGKRKGTPRVGNSVWIETNAVIVGNITVGDDVLIAPLSFVNFDVPSHSVVVGNPARIIPKEHATEGYIPNEIE